MQRRRLMLMAGPLSIVAALLLGVCNWGMGQAPQDDSQPSLAERVQLLESRVASLESQIGMMCAEDAALARINAEHKLTIASERLEQSERLAAHGYISSAQLQADRLAVDIAQRELQLASVESQNDREAVHLAVLNAEAALHQAQLRYEHSKRLQEKGYVSDAEAAQDKAAVIRAEKVLEAERLKLQMLTPPAADGELPDGN